MKNLPTKRNKKPWPTKDAMAQVYEKNLWGGQEGDFYSGSGSHHPEVVKPYIEVVASFLNSLEEAPTVVDLGCGDFNIGSKLLPLVKRYEAVDIVPNLIERNKKMFVADNLTFHCLDIAKDDWPKGEVAIVRNVLQHISNKEISAVVEKLSDFKYILLTEHLPDGDFTPNKDIISGQGIRIKKGSGVDLLAPPFNMIIKEKEELLSVPAKDVGGVLVTTLFRNG